MSSAALTSLEVLTGARQSDWVRDVRTRVDRFLSDRKLTLESLDALTRKRLDSPRHLLLTSSPVHGLANGSSDIDLIAVSEGEVARGIASQIFSEGNHVELIEFSVDDVARALTRLVSIAASPPGRATDELGIWDKTMPVRRKYLERLINGITTAGEMPYLDYLLPLAQAWKWSSLRTFREASLLALLSDRAGERRAPLGYALEAVLAAMDAILCCAGDVYSNKKWYSLRWQRLLKSSVPTDLLCAVSALEGIRQLVSRGLRGQPIDLQAALPEVMAELLQLRPLAFAPCERLVAVPLEHGDLLPRSLLCWTPGPASSASVVELPVPTCTSIGARDVQALERGAARDVLGALRAGRLRLQIFEEVPT